MIDIIIAWHTIDSVLKIIGTALGVLVIIGFIALGGSRK